MTIKIDKGIPIPVGKGRYPFQQMEIGDSFLTDSSSRQNIHNCARVARVQIKTRATTDGLRVWRVG